MFKNWMIVRAAAILFTCGMIGYANSDEVSGELIGFNEESSIAVYFMGLARSSAGELERVSLILKNVTDDTIYEILIDSYPLAQGFLVARDSEGHPLSDPFFSIGGMENATFDVNREVVYLIEQLGPGDTLRHEMFFKDFVQDISLSGADETRITLHFVARYREVSNTESRSGYSGERMSFNYVVGSVPVVLKVTN